MDFVEGRDIVVPLQQRSGRADALDRAGIHLPDGIEHRMVVCIQRVLLELGVTCNVDLCDAIGRLPR